MIDLDPGDDFTTIVGGAAAGETFTVKSGTHRQQTAPVKGGHRFLLEGGVIVSGATAGAPTTPVTAFFINGQPNGWPGGVEVIALDETPAARPRIEYYLGNGNDGAIRGRPDGNVGSNTRDWLLQGFIVQRIHDGAGGGTGARLGRTSTILRVRAFDCGFHGFGTQPDNGRWTDCEIDTCGTGTASNRGATKQTGQGLIVSGGSIHDCPNVGFWGDVNAGGTGADAIILQDVDIYKNGGPGVFAEISAGLIVRRCRLWENGGGMDAATFRDAALRVVCTPNVTVEDSIFYNNWKAIGVSQTGRYGGDGLLRKVENFLAQRNQIYILTGNFERQTGLTDNGPHLLDLNNPGLGTFDPYAPAANNRWLLNRYFRSTAIGPNNYTWKAAA